MLQIQNSTAESITGIKSFSQGVGSAAYGDVAIGIKSAVTAQGKREMAILRRLAKGVIEIGKRFIDMNIDFLSDTEVVRVTNDVFVTVDREELKGQFDLVIDISTSEVEQEKANKLSFLLQTLGNNVDFSITQKILASIADLNKLPELAKEIREYAPQPDPMAEKMRELELKKIELELSEIQSRIDLNASKAKLNQSNADLKDLDFVQEETGTKHARHVELSKAQAKGNQELEVTKALLTPDKTTGKVSVNDALGYKNLLENNAI